MRIIWSDIEQAFQAELTPGDQWRADMEAAKDAGFKTQGPPQWTWQTQKASVLNKLRKNRPASGLTLTEVALQHYKSISEKEEKKAEIKKAFETAKKAADKVSDDPKISGLTPMLIPAGKDWISKEDLPPFIPKVKPFIFGPLPNLTCFICEDLVYFYERTYPTPVCLWCELENEKK